MGTTFCSGSEAFDPPIMSQFIVFDHGLMMMYDIHMPLTSFNTTSDGS
jgi:hypothetical protein